MAKAQTEASARTLRDHHSGPGRDLIATLAVIGRRNVCQGSKDRMPIWCVEAWRRLITMNLGPGQRIRVDGGEGR
jgi:hypothetical protein